MVRNKIEFRVSVEPATLSIDPDKYWDQWEEHYLETHDDVAPEADIPEIDPDWLLEIVQDELNNGEIDLSETFEGYEIKVEYAA